MKLTKANYFSAKNQYLSNSKVGDWLMDKNFFYRKHIEKSIEPKVTDAMIIGQAVDTIITKGMKQFANDFEVVKTRSKKPTFFKRPKIQVNETQHKDIMAMAKAIKESQAYKDLKKFKRQQILKLDMPIGKHFVGLCGIPDFFLIEGDKCIIVDLKTAETAHPQKYDWRCKDFGYYRQLAMYTHLIQHNFPGVKEFEYRHLVVQKDPDKIFNVFTFKLDKDRVGMELEDLLNTIIPEIAVETKFERFNQTWDNAYEIGGIV